MSGVVATAVLALVSAVVFAGLIWRLVGRLPALTYFALVAALTGAVSLFVGVVAL